MSEPELTEEQLRELEAELERITVDDVLLQTIVSLINLGARKGALGAPPEAGLTPDWEQTRLAIEAVRALLPLLESRHADQMGPVRDAVSQLQMAYAQGTGAAGGPAEPAPEPPKAPPAGPGGGRLWVPGQ